LEPYYFDYYDIFPYTPSSFLLLFIEGEAKVSDGIHGICQGARGKIGSKSAKA
jgi:hypothetical protein